jgi:hypothetical protein
MVMRYHWGLAVGHLYTHNRPLRTSNDSTDHCLPDADPSDSDDAQELDMDSMPRAHDESEPDTATVLQTGEHEFLVNARDDDDWDSDNSDDPVIEESFSEVGDSDVEMFASTDE